MYVIMTYDCDQTRVVKVHKLCKQYLFPVQRSVFEGELTAAQLKQLKQQLATITTASDQLCFYTTESKRWLQKTTMGRPSETDTFIF